MGKFIPDLENILTEIVNIKKISKEEALQKVREFGKNKYPALMTTTNLDTVAYFYAQEMGIQIPIVVRSREDHIKVSDIKAELSSSFNLRGYLTNVRRGKKRKDGKKYFALTLTDESGSIDVLGWQNNYDRLDSFDLKKGDKVYIEGLRIQRFPNSTNWVVGYNLNFNITKISNGEHEFPELENLLVTPLSKIQIGSLSLIKAYIVRVTERPYRGCSVCMKGVKGDNVPALGTAYVCSKCNERVSLVEYKQLEIVLADESGQQVAKVPPWVEVPAMSSTDSGKRVLIAGKPNEREQIGVQWLTFLDNVQKTPISRTVIVNQPFQGQLHSHTPAVGTVNEDLKKEVLLLVDYLQPLNRQQLMQVLEKKKLYPKTEELDAVIFKLQEQKVISIGLQDGMIKKLE